MRPEYPHWINAASRWALTFAVILGVGVPIGLMAWVRTPMATGRLRAPEQPVPFDHRHHVSDDGIDCRYCHTTVEHSPLASVPSTDICMNCHNQIWNDSPLLQTVRESYYDDRPIRWQRVNRIPDFVYFNHSIHVNKGVGCEECHGRVDRMARVYQAQPLTMRWCLDCHRDPAKHLRPLNQVTAMGWEPSVDREVLGKELMKRYHVDPGTNCTTCHR